MNSNDKEYYKELKRGAKEDGVTLVCNEDPAGIYNGYTIAFKKAVANTNCRMVIVAVSYCAPEDEFKKKMGKYQALRKYYRGETIQLPLGEVNDAFLPSVLLDTFSV